MLGNLETHAIATAIVFGLIGFCYFVDRSYDTPEPESEQENSFVINELPVSQDIPIASDTVPEVALESPLESSMDTVEQPEPAADALVKHAPVATPGYQSYSTNYKNEFWPSPRPVNFVKALVKSDHVHIEGRLSHGKAIEILSSRAQMPPDVFLKTDPITYTKLFMPSHYNAAMLLGQSIQRLEDTIRRQQYLTELRRHG